MTVSHNNILSSIRVNKLCGWNIDGPLRSSVEAYNEAPHSFSTGAFCLPIGLEPPAYHIDY